MNGPSLQTALLSAANLLSLAGTIDPMYFLMRSGYSLHGVSDAREYDPLLRQVLLEAVVDLLALVDRARPLRGTCARPLGYPASRRCSGSRRDILPLLRGLLRRLSIIVEILEVYGRQVDAPRRDGTGEEVLQSPEPELLHPYRFVSDPRDLLDYVLVDPLVAVVQVGCGVGNPYLA